MSALPFPAELRRSLAASLPGSPTVKVIPRDTSERRCAVWASDHYEIAVFYSDMGAPLTGLVDALGQVPGVYWVTLMPDPHEDWPVRYRSTADFRPQVRALIRAQS